MLIGPLPALLVAVEGLLMARIKVTVAPEPLIIDELRSFLPDDGTEPAAVAPAVDGSAPLSSRLSEMGICMIEADGERSR